MPSTTRAPIFYKRNTPQAMTEAQSLPLGVPAFRPLKTSATTNIQTMLKKASDISATRKGALHQYPAPDLMAANLTFIQSQLAQTNAATGPIISRPMVISPQANAFKNPVPAFQALPSSVSRISTGQIVHTDNEIRKVSPATEQYSTIQRIDVSKQIKYHQINRYTIGFLFINWKYEYFFSLISLSFGFSIRLTFIFFYLVRKLKIWLISFLFFYHADNQ